METWMTEYEKQLHSCVTTYPKEYFFSVKEVPEVVAKMRKAFSQGSYNKDGRAIKACCRVFKIPYTYKAINNFIANHT